VRNSISAKEQSEIMKPDDNLSERLKGYNKGNEFGRGGYDPGNYSDVIWTRKKIAIAAICVAIPYITIIVVVGSVTSIGVVMPLIIAPVVILFLMGLAYGIGSLGKVKYRRQAAEDDQETREYNDY